MFETLKAKAMLGMAALLLLGGGALIGGPHNVAAQTTAPTPAATETCTAQDAAATAEPVEVKDATDADTVDLQCGDQSTVDTAAESSTESSVEAVEPAGDTGADNVDQQGDHQDPGDTQPDAATSGK